MNNEKQLGDGFSQNILEKIFLHVFFLGAVNFTAPSTSLALGAFNLESICLAHELLLA